MNCNSFNKLMMPINKEGYRFIVLFIVITLFLFYFEFDFLGYVATLLTIWCVLFFRDPERVLPKEENIILSPADGVVQMITEEVYPPNLNLSYDKVTRISIFMNVFNVHVNRVPVSGAVEDIIYIPGSFFNASLDKASLDNERQYFIINTKCNKKVVFVQIAGLIARRIVSFVNKGDNLNIGDRFGMIRFGSRIDIYLPKGVKPRVSIGQISVGGETILASLDCNKETKSILRITKKNDIKR